MVTVGLDYMGTIEVYVMCKPMEYTSMGTTGVVTYVNGRPHDAPQVASWL